MKKLILSAAILVTGFIASAQSALVPNIKNEKASFVVNGTTSITQFQLSGTEAQIETVRKQAATMKTIKFEANKQKGGSYACILTIQDKTDALYVQRIFGFLGFEKFVIDGTEKSKDELAKNLSSLK